MPAEDIINAALLQLQAKALEVYSIIKDLAAPPTQEGTLEKIYVQSVKLGQLESAIHSLQRNKEGLLSPALPPAQEKEEPPPKKENKVITPDMSPTLRKAMAAKEMLKKSKRVSINEKDES